MERDGSRSVLWETHQVLTILGKGQYDFCDGVTRRSFLRIGGLALGGLSLPQILRAEGDSAGRRSHKAVIMIFLAGGPPHQDMWDLKPDAPSDVRGELRPIRTNVPGIEICELFPLQAKIMDKLAILRTVVGANGDHYAEQCLTGRDRRKGVQPKGGWPCIGSVLSKLVGSSNPAVPAAIGLSPKTQHRPWGDNGSAGCLGPAHTPFAPEGEEIKDDMILRGVTLERLRDRNTLLRSFDQFRREADQSGAMEGLDSYQQQAIDVLTSSRLAEAFDITKEDPKTVARYGQGSSAFQDDGPWARLDQFLMARRLVEAGARCVTLSFGRWDWHGRTFDRARQNFPMLDQGISALVEDLHARGLEKDVTVIVWGEFGRTPKINKDGGRDHWPQVSTALLAGGGMRTGQVVGATNRLGEYASERPVRFEEVFATLYKNLGFDPYATTITDLAGRPHYLMDPEFQPIRELV
jgi:hypothetical protein